MIQKLFKFEVDQSIRVEELTRDTFVALANSENNFVVRLSSKDKRRLCEYFRQIGQPKRFAPKVFSAIIILAVRNFKNNVGELLVDIEYPGYELLITDIIKGQFPNILIYFGVIGKKSPAHYAAYGTYLSKRKLDLVVGYKEILRILKQKRPPELLHL